MLFIVIISLVFVRYEVEFIHNTYIVHEKIVGMSLPVKFLSDAGITIYIFTKTNRKDISLVVLYKMVIFKKEF